MRRTVVTRSAVPAPPYQCALVCIPIEAVPFTLGALVLKSQKYWYASEEDWHAGRKLLASFGKALLMDCARPIVDAIDRVYTLLDAGLNGTARTVTGEGTEVNPYVYNPPLSQAVQPTVFSSPSLRYDADIARQLLDTFVTGAATPAAPLPAVTNAHLAQIVDILLQMAAEEQVSPEQIAQIISILGAI